MLKDIPYSELKQDERAYEITQLRDQYGNSFTNIAKECEISVARVVQIYNKQQVKQVRLYLNHIAVMLGHESTAQVRKVFNAANECYQDRALAIAYLEKKYKDILTEYRAGEPGMPARVIESMPPFKPKLSQQTIAHIVKMREVEKVSFVAIAKELHMTQAKAKHTYEWFYYKQVLELIEALQEQAKSYEDKQAIWEHYYKLYRTSKKRYDVLKQGQTPVVDDTEKDT